MRPLRHALPAILAACLSAAAAHADSGATTTTPASAEPAAAQQLASHRVITWRPTAWSPPALGTASLQGLRVAIDPITGAWSMPTDDGLAADARVDGERPPLQSVLHADGTVQVILDDRFMEFAVASIGPLGHPVWTCVQGASGAERLLLRPQLAPVAPVAPAPPPVKWEEQ
jgi:hypothetical protein